jgi:hypothetical protein
MPDNVKAESPVVWGIEAIGKVIGRSHRQTYHLLSNHQIKSARKVGERWVAGRAALLREFTSVEQLEEVE